MRIKAAARAALVLVLAIDPDGLHAAEPDWYPVSHVAEGEFTAEFYVDTGSIQRDGDLVQFIERSEFTGHSRGWKQVIAQTLVDCAQNRNRTIRMKVTMLNGTSRVYDQRKVSNWTPISPGTSAALMRDFVCKR